MEKKTLLIAAFISALCILSSYEDTLVMYYSLGKLVVEATNHGVVKKFVLKNGFASHEAVSLTIHYEQELIYIADYIKIVRIHLVDMNGTRVVSGNGQLFVNPLANHTEEVVKTLGSDCRTGLLFTKSKLHGLCVDTVRNKLYVSCESFKELNLDGSGERVAFTASTYLRQPTIYQGDFYFAASSFQDSGLYTAKLNPNASVEANRFISLSAVSSIALMQNSSELFYIDSYNHAIRMIDLNTTKPVSKLVIHWTSYNNELRTLAASGGYLFWTDRVYNAVWDLYSLDLLGGKLKNGVIMKNNTWLVNYERGKRYAVYQLVAFEHNLPTLKTRTPYTRWNTMTVIPTVQSRGGVPGISFEMVLIVIALKMYLV